ncbi:MAG: hypothetical protein HOW73_45770 [Polyangiaceae bacterium]|nr:hypothetical protein [Polyangiaceae bacterium]
MVVEKGSLLLRWTTLVVVVLHTAFSLLSPLLQLPGDEVITNRYDNAFVPASYAFWIWPVIYAAFIAYAVIQLLPAQREVEIFDELDRPLIAALILATGWIIAFRTDQLALSVAVIVAVLGCALVMYARATAFIETGKPTRIRAPFSLFLGWITLTTIANVALALTKHGLLTHDVEGPWAAGMTIAATGIVATLALRVRDPILPAAIAWGSFAVFLEEYRAMPLVAASALTATIVCAATAIGLGVARGRRHLAER